MKPKVFVCQPIPPVAIERLKEYAEVEVFPFSYREISVAELESAARRSDYIFLMHSQPITASIVAANPKLKGFGVAHARSDTQDLAACAAAGIPLLEAKSPEPPADGGYSMNGYGLNPRATADLMITMLLCLAYRVIDSDKYCRGSGYFQEMTLDLMGQGTTGKTVSIWGLGKVATQAIRKLRAFDMTVLYNKRNRLSEAEEQELGIEYVADKDELISRADYLCMLVNFAPENEKIMGAKEFSLMKPSAYFINVGRGRLVDEEAMIEALQSGTIAGAGLDVFWNEPSGEYSPIDFDPYIPEALRKLDNVILTPHNGGATWDSRGAQTLAIANAIVDDIIARGE
jgi:glyoxylate reductase